MTIAINVISSKDFKDSDETPALHFKSDNIEIMMGTETDKIIEEIFESLLQRYQDRLEESIKGGNFIFDSVDVLYYKLNKISLDRGRSCIDSPEYLKNKKGNSKSK